MKVPSSGYFEHVVMVTGIGGQGIQLLAKTLAVAGVRHGMHAMLSADIGGEMRGGPSQATVVLGDEPLRSLPIVPSTDRAIVMHHRHSEKTISRLSPHAHVVYNSNVVEPRHLPGHVTGFAVPVVKLAASVDAPQAGSLVMLAAYCAVNGLLSLDLLSEAMTELLPPYRRQHVASNLRALECGSTFAQELQGVSA